MRLYVIIVNYIAETNIGAFLIVAVFSSLLKTSPSALLTIDRNIC